LLAGNLPSGGPEFMQSSKRWSPKLTEQRYYYKGSRYVTVGLLWLGLGTLTLNLNCNPSCRNI